MPWSLRVQREAGKVTPAGQEELLQLDAVRSEGGVWPQSSFTIVTHLEITAKCWTPSAPGSVLSSDPQCWGIAKLVCALWDCPGWVQAELWVLLAATGRPAPLRGTRIGSAGTS
ncbi:unnamed protein product [Natator depressus]